MTKYNRNTTQAELNQMIADRYARWSAEAAQRGDEYHAAIYGKIAAGYSRKVAA